MGKMDIVIVIGIVRGSFISLLPLYILLLLLLLARQINIFK